ncbi:L-rhamnose mutarotase [Paenibacillus sp.]|uniref:L-rhamnose mutarotase n=1 Tax=Paenibacillus sp. TaxID=58172 RepID=UPI0028114C7C|nr:L-rhamnose mutarotase [Paenibacillus sp.]
MSGRGKRIGSIVRLRDGCLDRYVQLHAEVWPELLELFRRHHVRNFTIFHRDGYLFSYKEYTGRDYEGDMAALMQKPLMQEWLRLTDACQEPWRQASPDVLWADGDAVFYME